VNNDQYIAHTSPSGLLVAIRKHRASIKRRGITAQMNDNNQLENNALVIDTLIHLAMMHSLSMESFSPFFRTLPIT